MRDARITQIYEGTNGVQAMDLAGRKLAMEDGGLPHRFFALVRQELQAAAGSPGMDEIVKPVQDALARLEKTTRQMQERAGDAAETGAAATDYLRFLALVSFGWMWVRMAARAREAGDAAGPLHRRKIKVARFFVERMLPQTIALETAIAHGAGSLMDLENEAF